jgi:hypothetical protein
MVTVETVAHANQGVMGNMQLQQMWFNVTTPHPWKVVTIAMNCDTYQGVDPHAVLYNFDITFIILASCVLKCEMA